MRGNLRERKLKGGGTLLEANSSHGNVKDADGKMERVRLVVYSKNKLEALRKLEALEERQRNRPAAISSSGHTVQS
jgi:hypothetical protein